MILFFHLELTLSRQLIAQGRFTAFSDERQSNVVTNVYIEYEIIKYHRKAV